MQPDRIEVSCSCGAHGVIESTYGGWVRTRYEEFLAAHAVCRQPVRPPLTRAQEYARSEERFARREERKAHAEERRQGCDCELCKDWAGLPITRDPGEVQS